MRQPGHAIDVRKRTKPGTILRHNARDLGLEWPLVTT